MAGLGEASRGISSKIRQGGAQSAQRDHTPFIIIIIIIDNTHQKISAIKEKETDIERGLERGKGKEKIKKYKETRL